MTRLLKSLRTGRAACALLTAATPVFGNIVESDMLNPDGTVTYFYEVDNASGSFDIAAWSLEFGFPTPDWNQTETASGGAVTVPNAHWIADPGIPVSGQSAQDFLSLDPGGDIGRGQKLNGFSFTSRFLPGSISYAEFSADGSVVSGQTTGPVAGAVPESGGPLEALAFVTIAAFAARLRFGRRSNHFNFRP